MNIGIIVAACCMGVIFGMVALMFLICGADKKHKIGGALVVLAIGALMFCGIVADAKAKNDAWNGGYCECGGKWELRAATKSKNGTTTKYYACDECRNEITQ